MSRRLLVAHRDVAGPPAGYLAAWARVRDAVAERGGRAWIFRRCDRPHRYIEFIEWKDAGGPPLPGADAVADARAALDAFGVGAAGTWEEVEPG